ncbi:MAG TPA: hypothetical protein VK174_17095 [Chitinophagales bacterium]|nr:hypothetical protein [Chitinophagales bacterium]
MDYTMFLPNLKEFNLKPKIRRFYEEYIQATCKNQLEYALSVFDDSEKERLKEILESRLQLLRDTQADLQWKYSVLIGCNSNELQHESNRQRVQRAMKDLFTRNGTVPTQVQVAQATGLSRPTVSKHISELMNSRIELAQQYSYMGKEVLDMVLEKAVTQKDIAAARLYLQEMARLKENEPLQVVEQLHAGGVAITQQMVNELGPEDLEQLQRIFSKEAIAEVPREWVKPEPEYVGMLRKIEEKEREEEQLKKHKRMHQQWIEDMKDNPGIDLYSPEE